MGHPKQRRVPRQQLRPQAITPSNLADPLSEDKPSPSSGTNVHAGWVFTITVLVCFVVQFPFVYKDVPGGDSGELIAEACLLGVAHPPGYPLFILLTHAAMRLVNDLLECPKQVCSPAWTANVLSALCGALAGGFTALTSQALSGPTLLEGLASFSAGLVFALSPLVWSYTIGAEVFALNNMLCAALLWLTVLVSKPIPEQHKFRLICCGAFIAGLGMANQHTSILFQIPLVGFVLFVVDRPLRISRVARFGCCYALGLSPYIHLLLSQVKEGSWGDTKSPQGFFRHVFRQEYGTLKLSPTTAPSESMLERTLAYAHEVATVEFGFLPWVAFFISLLGLLQIARNRNHAGKAVCSAWAFYLLVFHSLANLPLDKPFPREVHRRFWMQPNLVLSIGWAVGIVGILHRLRPPHGVSYLLLTCFVAYLVQDRISTASIFPTETVGAFGDALLRLETLEANAIILSHTDINWNTIRYKQACMGVRPDVTHLSIQMLPYPWYTIQQRRFFQHVTFPELPPVLSTSRGSKSNSIMITNLVKANWDRYPVYVDLHGINNGLLGAKNGYPGDVYFLPSGMLWQAVSKANVDKVVQQYVRNKQLQKSIGKLQESNLTSLSHAKLQHGTWEGAARAIEWDSSYQLACMLLNEAIGEPGTAFSLLALQLAAQHFVDIAHFVQVHGGWLSDPTRDVARNAALAGVRLLSEINNQGNPSQQTALAASRPRLQDLLSFFLDHGSPKDPFYAQVKSLRELVDKL